MVVLEADRYDPALKRGAQIGSANLATGSIGTSEIAAGAVATEDIADSAVTETKIAASVKKVLTGSFDMADASSSYFFTVKNPESGTIYVDDVIVDVTTAGGAAGTMDVGTHMVTASSVDGMYVGKSMNATAVYSKGAAATGSILKVTSSVGYVIADLGSGTSGNAAGSYRVEYHT